mmetsp:Transcript_29026/g.56982  ORF Transcript_29026/g.56982 Transcript_29026/m.56982 type:complete len:204 (+) Transcript_29026:438-1049(+)
MVGPVLLQKQRLELHRDLLRSVVLADVLLCGAVHALHLQCQGTALQQRARRPVPYHPGLLYAVSHPQRYGVASLPPQMGPCYGGEYPQPLQQLLLLHPVAYGRVLRLRLHLLDCSGLHRNIHYPKLSSVRDLRPHSDVPLWLGFLRPVLCGLLPHAPRHRRTAGAEPSSAASGPKRFSFLCRHNLPLRHVAHCDRTYCFQLPF